jgi:hypothetical protein
MRLDDATKLHRKSGRSPTYAFGEPVTDLGWAVAETDFEWRVLHAFAVLKG